MATKNQTRQEVNGAGNQVLGEADSQVQLNIRVNSGGIGQQMVNIGAVYTGPVVLHVFLDVGNLPEDQP